MALMLLPLAILGLTLGVSGEGVFDYSHAGVDWEGLCQSGEFQSPLQVVRSRARSSRAYSFSISYQISDNFTVTNNNHTFVLRPQNGTQNFLYFGSDTYKLVQVHGHAVSEHAFDGYLTPFELHFVHANAANSSQLLVVGTLLRFNPNDKNNTFIDTWLSQTPHQAGSTVTVNSSIDFYSQIVPRRKWHNHKWQKVKTTLYTYPGSLTTPSCSEGVTWVVIDPNQGPTISVKQLEQFEELVSETTHGIPDNNRPPQPLGGRKIRRFAAYL